MSKVITYKSEDIFEDIEGDEENVLMNLPPEILEQMGWTTGDTLIIKSENGGLTISKKEKNEQE